MSDEAFLLLDCINMRQSRQIIFVYFLGQEHVLLLGGHFLVLDLTKHLCDVTSTFGAISLEARRGCLITIMDHIE